ncbi:HAD hydrolase-like protein [Flavobacterium sp.]|uniref:HAD hydrolase-like protein n=1 Tax=Flavobacterium sp. TaxID=239 RepID=UPI0037526B32
MIHKFDKLILLDFDGTILDSTTAWSNVYLNYCNLYNLDVSESIRLNTNSLPFFEWIDAIKTTHIIKEESQFVFEKLNELALEVYKTIAPKKGFIEFVTQQIILKNNIIIISREEPNLISQYLKHYEIASISKVLQDKFRNRATTNFYYDIASNYECTIKDITLIDDSLSHCVSAKQAGLYVVGLNDNHSEERQDQMKAICDLYINDFTPLLQL